MPFQNKTPHWMMVSFTAGEHKKIKKKTNHTVNISFNCTFCSLSSDFLQILINGKHDSYQTTSDATSGAKGSKTQSGTESWYHPGAAAGLPSRAELTITSGFLV